MHVLTVLFFNHRTTIYNFVTSQSNQAFPLKHIQTEYYYLVRERDPASRLQQPCMTKPQLSLIGRGSDDHANHSLHTLLQ